MSDRDIWLKDNTIKKQICKNCYYCIYHDNYDHYYCLIEDNITNEDSKPCDKYVEH